MRETRSLTEIAAGESAVVLDVTGGRGLARRLEAMGIRPGVLIMKTSGHRTRGPVTVRVGNAQLALGHGMAGRVMVESVAGPAG